MKKIEIILHDNGNVEVNGPVDNKVLCYGLLDCARDIIQEYGAAKAMAADAKPGIERASIHDIRSLAVNGKRGHS